MSGWNGVKELRNFLRSLQANDTLYTAVSVKPGCLNVALALMLWGGKAQKSFHDYDFSKDLCSL